MGKLEKVIVENGITYVLGEDDIYFNGRVQYLSSLLLVVNKIWQRYFNTTDRKKVSVQ